MRRTVSLVSLVSSLLAGLSGLTACGSDGAGTGAGGAGGEGTTAALVYYRDAKPIIDAKCATCHVAGGIGPFALTTFEEVSSHAAAIRGAVEAGTMPPWPADSACNSYYNDRSLTAEQIGTLVGWVDAGAAEGDPAEEGSPLVSPNLRPLSRVDRTIAMPEPYTMVEQPDEYRCFVMDYPGTATEYVTGLGVKPGNAAVVHHVIAFVASGSLVDTVAELDASDPGPGYPCFGGPGFQNPGWLGAWAPGAEGYDYPDGTGIPVEPGSKIVVQVHYNSLTSGPQPDQTSVLLKTDSAVDKTARLQPWTNVAWVGGTGMEIPPATNDVTHSFGADPTAFVNGGKPMMVYSSFLHMHKLGQSGRVSVKHTDGSETCLLDIPEYNFHWQGAYQLLQPVVLQPGDKLSLKCTWDNPTMNNVSWGEGTEDEMCLTGVYFTSME
ncbi:MAG: monooxygenase [Myxococcales bacterium]|nr:monooxygenase [Myxococcales bacterium]